MEQLGLRILNFYEFIFVNGLEGGISFYEKEFHVNVTKDGKIYSSGQNERLTIALDECGKGLANVGM